MDKEREEEIKNKIIEIYNKLEEDIEEEGKDGQIEKVTYYEYLEIELEFASIGIEGAYVVRFADEQEKVLYEIHDEDMMIATVDENGMVQFSQEYLNEMKNGELLANGGKFKEPEELQEGDKEMTEEEIQEAKEEKEQESEEEQEKEDEEKQEQDEEEQEVMAEEEEEEKVAEVMGLEANDITSKSKINPKQILVDNGELGKESFEDIAGLEEGKYQSIYVVNANRKTDKNKKFAFVGVTKDGEVEYLDNLKTKGTTQTERNIYSINRDGSAVEEKQTTEMFETGKKDQNLSVTIGQYGIIEVNYLRRSPGENKYIGSEIETQYQRPTRRQVNEFMSKNQTTNTELNKAVRNAEEQMHENSSAKTDIRNIDNDPNNDVALDLNEEITLHDGTVTTLGQEAERLDLTIEEYNNRFEKADGDCAADKISEVRIEEAGEERVHEEHEGREERLTPEEEAWLRKENGDNE